MELVIQKMLDQGLSITQVLLCFELSLTSLQASLGVMSVLNTRHFQWRVRNFIEHGSLTNENRGTAVKWTPLCLTKDSMRVWWSCFGAVASLFRVEERISQLAEFVITSRSKGKKGESAEIPETVTASSFMRQHNSIIAKAIEEYVTKEQSVIESNSALTAQERAKEMAKVRERVLFKRKRKLLRTSHAVSTHGKITIATANRYLHEMEYFWRSTRSSGMYLDGGLLNTFMFTISGRNRKDVKESLAKFIKYFLPYVLRSEFDLWDVGLQQFVKLQDDTTTSEATKSDIPQSSEPIDLHPTDDSVSSTTSPPDVTAEPTAEPTTEPASEPTAEPTTEPTAEPNVKLTSLSQPAHRRAVLIAQDETIIRASDSGRFAWLKRNMNIPLPKNDGAT